MTFLNQCPHIVYQVQICIFKILQYKIDKDMATFMCFSPATNVVLPSLIIARRVEWTSG